jgi:hypothetical protein
MSRIRRSLVGFGIAGAFTLVLGVVSGIRADVEPGTGATPVLYASIQALGPEGPGGAEASVSWDLSTATVARPVVGAGSTQYPSLCAISSGGPAFQPGTRVGWTVEGRLLSVDAEGARVAIRWSRNVMDPSLAGLGDMVREYETRLQEGSRSVIDFLRSPLGEAPDCDGVVVRMWLEFRDPPELARAVLDYDVWLVHRDASGREALERSRGRTLQGEDLPYRFPSVEYAEDGRFSPGGFRAEFGGRVKGRVRPDGRIDLSVRAARTLYEGALGNGSSGEKQATIDSGETIELELPAIADHGAGFEAQRTSIRVTVRRVT